MENKKIRILIVDDEQDSREILTHRLRKLNKKIEITGEAEDIDHAHQLIFQHKPDVVFLDIQLPGKSAFELLMHYPEIPFQVVFVTSYDEFAIKAIKFNALDYLLKPIDTEELEQCLSKIEKVMHNYEDSKMRLNNLADGLRNKGRWNKIPVHYGDMVKLLEINDILFIQANGRYTLIQTLSGEKYTTSHYLKDFEIYLKSETTEFIRINKNTLINSGFITAYGKAEPAFIELKHQHSFEVSRRKKTEILQKLKSYFCTR